MSFRAAHTYGDLDPTAYLEELPVFAQLIEEQARQLEDGVFLHGHDQGGDATVSYRDLHELSLVFAQWFRSRALHTEHGVALAPSNNLSSVIAIFGLMRLGIPTLILHPQNPRKKNDEILSVTGIQSVLFSYQASRENFAPSAIGIPTLPDLLGRPAVSSMSLPEVHLRDTAFYFATSGTTGSSKIVRQLHLNLAANAEAVIRHHHLQKGTRFLGCLPIHHVNGFHFTLMACFYAGAEVRLLSDFHPFEYPRVFEDFQPDLASVVPSILEMLLETWKEPQIPSNFRYFVSAAAALAGSAQNRLYHELGVRVTQGYGLTETTNFSLTMPADVSDEMYCKMMEDFQVPPLGIAVFGNDVTVLTPEGTEAGEKQIGEICIRGLNVMQEYLNNSADTEAVLQDWFHTGDLGYYTHSAVLGEKVFTHTGRLKNVAKIRGESVSLEEVERKLERMAAVREAVCVALEDRFYGELLAVGVVPQEAGTAISPSEVRTWLSEYFPQAILPKHVLQLDSVPKSSTGKLDRRRIKSLFEARLSREDKKTTR